MLINIFCNQMPSDFILLVHIQYLKNANTRGAGAALGHVSLKQEKDLQQPFLLDSPPPPIQLGPYLEFRANLGNFSGHVTQQGHILKSWRLEVIV